jgi:hypothetical protein
MENEQEKIREEGIVMEKSFSIERKELTCILINIITSKMLFAYPRGIVETSGNAAWIQTIYVSLISCLFFWFVIFIYRKAEMKKNFAIGFLVALIAFGTVAAILLAILMS